MPRTRSHPWLLLALGLLVATGGPAAAYEIPWYLPRYDLDVQVKIAEHRVEVRQTVTWINYHQRPSAELVFNAHSAYFVPKKDIGFMAKMMEILRINPGEGLILESPLQIHKATLVGGPFRAAQPVARIPAEPNGGGKEGGDILPPPRPLEAPKRGPPVLTDIPVHFKEDNDTALVLPLPQPVNGGEAVTVVLEFTLHLPQKQGRWGQWEGVTFLSNWLPVLAFSNECGWQPTPFIPWHQPFFNEAGVYHARVVLPCDQKFASSGSVLAGRDLGNGLQEVELFTPAARDFAFLCSACFVEFSEQCGPVKVRCLAFPQHEHYAKIMLQTAGEAITTYSRWFGPYPNPEFSIVESFFGWNGNECAGLVMIDERVFGMPHLAEKYVEYLVAHE